MVTKLRAARRASEAGVPCAIVPGQPGVLPKVFAGEEIGTLVLAQGERRRLRKRWMLDLKTRGEIRVDDGARTALIERKKSLLPSGIKEVRGSFLSGDAVEIATLDGKPFARGARWRPWPIRWAKWSNRSSAPTASASSGCARRSEWC